MAVRLRELIKSIRACKTAAEERAVVARESANIRSSLAKEETEYRHRNIAKLLFIQMLGYPTHFGQIDCMKLIVSPSYSDKRLGYLGLMLLLDERQEVLTLATHSLKTDLSHPNQYIVGLSLCALANIANAGISRDVAPDIEKLLQNSNSYLRKKAALCAIRIIRKVPELAENFIPRVKSLLGEKTHSVQLTGIALLTELFEIDPGLIPEFRKLVTPLVRTLKSLVLSGYAPEYDVAGVTDPFLQVKILRALRYLGRGDKESSDIMNDILAQVATNTEGSRNVGNSILYECVLTIMDIESESGLRVLAINILGKFLLNRDNNIRYVALNTLSKIVQADSQAVQRHRNTIVECLKDQDVSIRKRALELIYCLVNSGNVKGLVKELVQFLENTEAEFKAELTVKLAGVVENYAPDKRWHFDSMVKIMSLAGQHVPEYSVRNLIAIISQTPELQSYASQTLYLSLSKDLLQQSLVQVGVWCMGEFGNQLIQPPSAEELPVITDTNVVDLLEAALKFVASTTVTKGYVLNAMAKLTERWANNIGIQERLRGLIHQYTSHLHVDIQQRACEYFVLSNQEIQTRATTLSPMPAIEMKTQDPSSAKARAVKSDSSVPIDQGVPLLGDPLPGLVVPNSGAGGGTGLFEIDFLGGGAPSVPVVPTSGAGGGGSGLDFLNFSSGPSTTTTTPSILGGDFGLGALNIGAPILPTPTTNTQGALAPIIDPYAMPSTPDATLTPTTPGLLDLPLTTSPVVQQQEPPPSTTPSLGVGPSGIPSILAFQKNGISLVFEFVKQPNNPALTGINLIFSNSNSTPVTGLSFQAAVPSYIKLQMLSPSGNTLTPNNTTKITQRLNLNNTLHGQKPIQLKGKLEWTSLGQHLCETFPVTNFPPELQ